MSLIYAVDYRIRLDTLSEGFDGKTCWVQCRAGTIPPGGADGNALPIVVLTMQELLLTASDVYYALNEMRTDDMGKSWSGPMPHEETLGRRMELGDREVVIADATPRWHAATGRLLTTGHTVRYLVDALAPEPHPRQTAYSVYEPEARAWRPWKTLEMPHSDGKFFNCGAGCTQRFDLENGDILLPVYFAPAQGTGEGVNSTEHSTVVRCRFDGTTLCYVEHGTELTTPEGGGDDPAGFTEPSLTRFQDRFYLTLRNDVRGYVTVGDDGLHYGIPQPWAFDDGTELGNYNTQQHWVTHSDGLFLVYTRRGLNNDHVFRHRAPLLMAEVDPDRLCVLRSTERVLVPERGARLGNFAVTEVSPQETWVTVSEWMQTWGPVWWDIEAIQKHGSNNCVFAARIVWDRPNRGVAG